jgi:lysophospholipase L1-like esterase
LPVVVSFRRGLFWLVVACSIALPFVVAESVLRHMGLGTPIRYGINGAFRYAPLPNQRVERWGAVVTIDGQGLRGTEPWSTPADLHVLFVGDSVTWGGTQMDDAAIFSSLTCGVLEARLAKRVVCSNAGVNNYRIDNMRARLRYDRETVDQADVIVVTIVAEDTQRGLSDLESRYFYSSVPPGPMPAIGEALGYVLYKASWHIRHHALAYDQRYDIEVGLASLDLLLAELAALRESGKATLLVFSPTLRDFNDPVPELNRAVREHVVGRGAPYLDLVEAVGSWGAPDGVDVADLYSDGLHLTATGHALYGGWIGAALVANLANGSLLAGRSTP